MRTEMPEQPAQHLCPEALGDGTHFSATRSACDFKPSWVQSSTPPSAGTAFLLPCIKPWKMEFALRSIHREETLVWLRSQREVRHLWLQLGI